ncbi:serine hydrolase domain-containing protein [Nocardia sp. NPDC004582]
MRETTYPGDAALPEPYLKGYGYDENVAVDVTDRIGPAVFGAAGSMVSTISDLAAYGPRLATGALLKPETFQARTRFTALDGGPLGYGLGITQIGQWLGHNGAVLGYTDQLGYLPDKRVTVAVAVNQFAPATAPTLPVDASLLWNDLVEALYPGTGMVHAADPQVVDPPTPSAPDVERALAAALGSDAGPGVEPLRIIGDTHGDIMREWAAVNAPHHGRTQFHDVHRLRSGLVVATGVSSADGHSIPIEIPLQPKDGVWQLLPGWVCQFFTAADRPAACDGRPHS